MTLPIVERLTAIEAEFRPTRQFVADTQADAIGTIEQLTATLEMSRAQVEAVSLGEGTAAEIVVARSTLVAVDDVLAKARGEQ